MCGVVWCGVVWCGMVCVRVCVWHKLIFADLADFRRKTLATIA